MPLNQVRRPCLASPPREPRLWGDAVINGMRLLVGSKVTLHLILKCY